MTLSELVNSSIESADPSGADLNGLVIEVTKHREENSISIDNNSKFDLCENWQALTECPEFGGCNEILNWNHPYLVDDDGRIHEPVTVRLDGDFKFAGKAIIKAIYTLPAKIDYRKRFEPVTKNACLTETIYDSKTFEPHREIVIRINQGKPLNFSDSSSEHVELRKKTHELIDEIFDFPEMFVRKQRQTVVISGFFEKIFFRPSKTSRYKCLRDVKLSNVSQMEKKVNDFFTAFYFEEPNQVHSDTFSMDLDKFFIPSGYRDVFYEETLHLGNRIEKRHIVEFLHNHRLNDIVKMNEELKSMRKKHTFKNDSNEN